MAAAWHATPADEVLARLESRPDGLTAAEADRRLAEHGPNALTRHGGPSAWQVLVRQFTSPLIYALLASAAVAFALGDVPDGAVVLAVVVLNALIGFVQEYRAGKAIQALAQLVSEPATVRRDGRWTQAGAEASCPGTSCRSRPVRGSSPTCGSCRRAGCARTRRRSPASRCRWTRPPTRSTPPRSSPSAGRCCTAAPS